MPAPRQPQYPHQPSSLFRRALGAPILFSIIYTAVASAIYFSLGVIADRALGLTPVVFLLAGLFFVGFWPKSMSDPINDALMPAPQTVAQQPTPGNADPR